MIVNTHVFCTHVYSQYKYFKSHERTWINRIFSFLDLSNHNFPFDDYVFALSQLGLANYKQELNFICSILVDAGYFISRQQRRFYEELEKGVEKQHRDCTIATTTQIKNALEDLSGADWFYVVCLAASGRRGADFDRLLKKIRKI